MSDKAVLKYTETLSLRNVGSIYVEAPINSAFLGDKGRRKRREYKAYKYGRWMGGNMVQGVAMLKAGLGPRLYPACPDTYLTYHVAR